MNLSTKNTYCTNYFRVLEGVKNGRFVSGAMRMRCKRWSCNHCAKEKAYRIGKRCEDHFAVGQTRFLTLTIKPIKDKVQALRNIKKAWNRLRLKMTRKIGKFKYCWVLEAQPKTGMPHLHILLDKYVNWLWLKSNVESCGFGPVFDIRAVKSAGVLRYVIKYTSKGIGDETLEKCLTSIKGRRVGYSRGMSDSPAEKTAWVVQGAVELGLDLKIAESVLKAKLDSEGVTGYEIALSKHSIFVTFEKGALSPDDCRFFIEYAKSEASRIQARRGLWGADLNRFDHYTEYHARIKPLHGATKAIYALEQF